MKRILTWVAAMGILLLASQALALPAGNLVLQVPDWNQPNTVEYPFDGLPPGGYPNWCSPTAGGNIMGYWEDVKGCTGLTDRQAFSASPGYPGTAGTWQQGLYHDGIIEMGWHMNTGGWFYSLSFPPNSGGTSLTSPQILAGLLAYAQASWTDNDYPVPGMGGTGIVKVAFPDAMGSWQEIDMVRPGPGGITMAQMWAKYTGEIDAGRPVEVTFQHWVDTTPGPGAINIPGHSPLTAETYPWDLSIDPHSVVGVGYIDITPGDMRNDGMDEWFICQDGWGTTGRYVAVPLELLGPGLQQMWLRNDYITYMPEPATISLLALGALAMIRRKPRR